MEIILAALAAYALTQSADASPAPASIPAAPAAPATAAPATAAPAAPVREAPRGLSGADAMASMGIIPDAPKIVTDLRTALDPTGKGAPVRTDSETKLALGDLEKLAKQRETLKTKLFAMPPGDATVNPVGTGVAVALDRLPADHYTFAEGWYRTRT